MERSLEHGITPNLMFYEVQRFGQWWIRAIQGSLFVFFAAAAIRQLVFGISVGNKPVSNGWMLTLFVFFGVLLPVFFQIITLHIMVKRDGLFVKFFPFDLKYIHLHEITSCAVQEYRPIADYGGWGIRYGSEGKAYTVSGNKGVMLVFANGKKLLLGSENPENLASAIKLTL